MRPTYELKTYYSGGGIHYALEWYTHNTGTILVLAKSDAAIKATITNIFNSHGPVEFKSYNKINIVAPTDFYKKQFDDNSFEKDVILFKSFYAFQAKEYYEKYKVLPKQMNHCTQYTSDDELEENDWNHYSCNSCEGTKMILVNGTWEECFIKHNEEHYVSNPFSYDKRLVCPTTNKADLDKEVFFRDRESYFPSTVYYEQNPYFFFQYISSIDIEPFTILSNDFNAKIASDRDKRSKAYKIKNEKENEKQFKLLLKFFN